VGLLSALVAFILVVGAIAAVAALVAAVVAAVALHVALATLVVCSTPPTRCLLHKRWWALATLLTGPVGAGTFFVLHYRPAVPLRCFVCGYLRSRGDRWTACPECGTPACPRLLQRGRGAAGP
jgi:membrane-bound metal-dependent hydrolase YbcI (DUF457 family)